MVFPAEVHYCFSSCYHPECWGKIISLIIVLNFCPVRNLFCFFTNSPIFFFSFPSWGLLDNVLFSLGPRLFSLYLCYLVKISLDFVLENILNPSHLIIVVRTYCLPLFRSVVRYKSILIQDRIMQNSAEPCSLTLEQNNCSLEWFLHSVLSSNSNGLLLLLFFA